MSSMTVHIQLGILVERHITQSAVCAVVDYASSPLQHLSLPSSSSQSVLSCSRINMAVSIDSPAKCKLRSFIRFLQAEKGMVQQNSTGDCAVFTEKTL
ncbi:hypothetical protein J6590_031905 [Homalodisca vitripennis]|nr:hypothetical protein J6590_031905 [Homalodisca vitripennis]